MTVDKAKAPLRQVAGPGAPSRLALASALMMDDSTAPIEYLRLLSEQLPDVWWVGTPALDHYQYVTPAFRSLWDLEPEDLYLDAEAWRARVHPDDLAPLEEQVEWTVGGDFSQPLGPEFRIVRRDDSIRWAQVRTVPLLDAAGRVERLVGSCYDITERKLAEASFGHGFQVLEWTEGAVVVLDGEQLEVTAWSRRAKEQFGYRADEIVGRPSWEIFPGTADEERRNKVFGSARRSGAVSFPSSVIAKDGTEHAADVTVVALTGEGQNQGVEKPGPSDIFIVYLRASWPDLSDQDKRHAQQVHQLLRELAPEGFLCFDRQGVAIDVNVAYCQMTGLARGAIVGKTYEELMDERLTRAELAALIGSDGDSSHRCECLANTADGVGLPVEVAFRYEDVGEGRFFCLVQDISRRKAAEAQKARFVSQVLQAQESERRRVARDLHDGVGQSLTSLLLRLRALGEDLEDEVLCDDLEELRKQTSDIIGEVRRVSHGLYASAVEDLGLESATEELVAELQSVHDLEIELTWSAGWDLPYATSAHLYRVIQEALNNVVRHAAARVVRLTFGRLGEDLHLRIEDDGVGFEDDAADRERGLGLQGIHERLGLIGAVAEVRSKVGEGTRIDVRIPGGSSQPESSD